MSYTKLIFCLIRLSSYNIKTSTIILILFFSMINKQLFILKKMCNNFLVTFFQTTKKTYENSLPIIDFFFFVTHVLLINV